MCTDCMKLFFFYLEKEDIFGVIRMQTIYRMDELLNGHRLLQIYSASRKRRMYGVVRIHTLLS